MAMQYLDAQLVAVPSMAAEFSQLADAWQKKLWHQMGERLIELTKNEYFQQDTKLIELHQNFVRRFADHLKQLVFAQVSVAAARQHADAKLALGFLEAIAKLEKLKADPQASLFCRLEMVVLQVKLGNIDVAKAELEECKKEQDAYPGIMEAIVYSKLHLASLILFKAIGDASKYFASAMLFLTYTPLDSLSPQEQLALSLEVGVAALLGDSIYNFGELLQHPVLRVLDGTQHAWLSTMLQAFNSGDLKTYDRLFAAVADSQPELAAKRQFLQRKVRIMALMELVFSKPSSERTMAFAEIAQACDVPILQVELVVMKAFSLKVLKGSIDQLKSTVRFSWVQPRVLSMEQTARLRDRLQAWGANVENVASDVASQAQGVMIEAR